MAEPVDGIVLIAKQSGLTSFSSLWQVKNALGTKKIGHTGTLDNFADGLLVALSGHLTHLAPYVTGCDKEYLASIAFGVETDTLDPDGTPVKSLPMPSPSEVERALPSFVGRIMQRPPQYSAVHVDGKRSSDRIRDGEAVSLSERPVTVRAIDVLDSRTALIDSRTVLTRLVVRVSCSKGTYIRSLARDIAESCGSCASLLNLRRTKLGPFVLGDAAGFSMLPVFDSRESARYGKGEKPPSIPPEDIDSRVVGFSRAIAEKIGLRVMEISAVHRHKFSNGARFSPAWLSSPPVGTYAVFCENDFLGVIGVGPDGPSYDFVVGGRA